MVQAEWPKFIWLKICCLTAGSNKILRDQFNDDKTLLNQFKHEAQSAARLSSPSIINIFDVCEEEGKSFIVMEYVEGKTLKDLLEEKGSFRLIRLFALPKILQRD